MKFLMVNGEFYRDSNGKLITVPDNYNNELLTIGGKVLNIGGKLVGDKYSRGIFLTQLSTPANVSANGTTVSWDEVENATSYEVRADGVSIGTVDATNATQEGTILTIENASATQTGTEVTIE